MRFAHCSNRLTDLKVKLRLPEGWSCADPEQGIFLAILKYGEILNFDIIAPENAGCFERVELEIFRNGFLCPELIALPMQIKGHYGAAMIKQPADARDEWRIRNIRAHRKFD